MAERNETRAPQLLSAAEIAAVTGGGTLLSDLAPPPPPTLDGHIHPTG